jgi:hypothetical protein
VRTGVRVFLALLAVIVTAACGVRPTGVIAAGSPAVAQQAVPQTTVYLARQNRLVPVRRVAFPGAPQAALYVLWERGATGQEAAEGMVNPIGVLSDFHVIFASGDLPTGVLQVSFLSAPDVTDLVRAQIVCSGTAQPGVRRVQLVEEGTSALRRPMTCSQFRRYT